MLPWTRPEPHNEFTSDARKLLDNLREAVTARSGNPHSRDFENREIWTGKWKRRDQTPGLHKAVLSGSEWWHTKCVWCEQLRDVRRELDVEHFRPKVCVTEWRGNPPIVSDTPPGEHEVGPGYWWLAFDWNNYSLACRTCNQGWKRNLFPVAAPRPTCIEGVESAEKPLLLDPGSSFRTRDHFRWTNDGIVEDVSPEGYATIVTFGLNRRELTVRRGKVALDALRALDRFYDGWRSNDRQRYTEAYDTLGALGERSREFTSMVRWLVEEGFGCSWDELDRMPL